MEIIPEKKAVEKFCSSCRKLVPGDQFNRDSKAKDGMKYKCKPCCIPYNQERYRKRKYLAESKDLCLRFGCKFRPNKGGKLCALHFFKAVATNLKNPSLWKKLESLAEKQNYICNLTGDKLLTGVNMSLDHIKPISKYPELAVDLKNMQWVTKWANAGKSDLTVAEFAMNCMKVIAKCPELK